MELSPIQPQDLHPLFPDDVERFKKEIEAEKILVVAIKKDGTVLADTDTLNSHDLLHILQNLVEITIDIDHHNHSHDELD